MSAEVITTRWCTPDELHLVNVRYAEVRFQPSAEGDRQLVAFAFGHLAGLGRLVSYSPAVELGGIWVDPAHRGQGLARAVVSRLVAAAGLGPVYCLPFAKLEPFYASFGFRQVSSGEAPSALQVKLQFCAATYADPTLLMRLVERVQAR